MWNKDYYQERITNQRVTQSGVLKLAGLLFIGIIVFGNLYAVRQDIISLIIVIAMNGFLLIDLFVWFKIQKKINHLQHDLLVCLNKER